ncbi:polyprenyl synthetase family protein [Treponema parvum]|uniref:Polyprenyl synthetase family protein n=1 Tax=Treponema parvum TaxID=138851 RepID=A0A975ICZ7_9SPIR|nr:polyprenyl synthetase family protein [Treponema parvum]QTQ12327.1 polyprenyl synthetase family protein [Treponema parvum]
MDKDRSDSIKEELAEIEAELDKALPQTYTREWKNESFLSIPDCVSPSHLNALTIPCRELLKLGGKRWRPLLLILCAKITAEHTAKKDPEAKKNIMKNARHIVPLVEFVHTASLIHDDIEDASEMRRGKPAAHITFGIDTAINAASWLYFEAAVCVNTLQAPEHIKNRLFRLYTQELRRLHLGQAMDILWHREPGLIPSVEEYKAMVENKTGTLASLAAQAGIIAAGGDESDAAKAGKIAAQIGIGFQILDDVQNLTTGNAGKQRGDDIVENKKSLPVLLHLQKRPQDKDLITRYMASARKNGIDDECVEKCISLLEKNGAVKDAYAEGKDLVNLKSRELSALYSGLADDDSDIVRLFRNMIPDIK